MSQFLVVSRILTNHLAGLRQLNSSFEAYIKLDPFSPPLQTHHKDILQFNSHTLPAHTRLFEELVISHKVRPPPPSPSAFLKTSSFGLMAHLPLQSHTVEALATLLRSRAEQLNDSIRQLNDHDYEQESIRKALVTARNSCQDMLKIFPASPPSKVIDFMFS